MPPTKNLCKSTLGALVAYGLDVLVPRETQCHHEEPRPDLAPRLGVEHRGTSAKVDLRRLTRSEVKDHHRARRLRFLELVQAAAYRIVVPDETVIAH